MNIRTLLILAAVCVAAQTANAADNVAGDWKIDGTISSIVIDISCNLVQDAEKLTGACKGKDIPTELPVTGKLDGKTATWSYSINYQGQQFDVEYQGTLTSATEMTGTISVGGNASGSFTGKKH